MFICVKQQSLTHSIKQTLVLCDLILISLHSSFNII